MKRLAPLLERFFVERLQKQRQAKPNTVATYSYAFSLLLRFAQERLRKAPSDLVLDDLDAPLIGAYLEHLETERKNCVKSRNARLAPIRSFFRYVEVLVPEQAEFIQRVLAIPQKRFDRKSIDFLNIEEIHALLEAPDRTTWIGRRDYTLMLVTIHTGLRVSEVVGLRVELITWGKLSHIRCHGKGRKERCTPLTKPAVKALREWLAERDGAPSDVVFPSRRGGMLSRDAVERLVAKHASAAGECCPSVVEKHITPHVLRHTTAVQMHEAGVDLQTIALVLGHERLESLQVYLHADLPAKEAALSKLAPIAGEHRRFHASDALLDFLKGLGLCRVE